MNLSNGIDRPYILPNAWVADPADAHPTLTIQWEEPQFICSMELCFDNDFDHPMESVLMGHPEHEMPFCVKVLTIKNDKGQVLHRLENNHQSIRRIDFDAPVQTRSLIVQVEHPSPAVPASLFAIRCFNS
jgi:hypothetical protein